MAIDRRPYTETPRIFVADKRVLLSPRSTDIQQDYPYTAEPYPPSLRYKFIPPRITEEVKIYTARYNLPASKSCLLVFGT